MYSGAPYSGNWCAVAALPLPDQSADASFSRSTDRLIAWRMRASRVGPSVILTTMTWNIGQTTPLTV